MNIHLTFAGAGVNIHLEFAGPDVFAAPRTKDYYQLLGVRRNASQRAIDKAGKP